jgi:metal-responsive CopG/Arc/MetJ family transcriptional regulator
MSTKHPSPHAETGSERVIFTLPKALAADLEEYARLLRNGNKSGFVADAIRSYIDHFRKRRHTQLLRQGYAQAAEQSEAVNREWEPLDDETWKRLDELEGQPRDHS